MLPAALPEQKAACPVLETTSPRVFLQPNAEPAAMNADITPIVMQPIKIVIMVVLPQTLAVSALPASSAPTSVLQYQLLSLSSAADERGCRNDSMRKYLL